MIRSSPEETSFPKFLFLKSDVIGGIRTRVRLTTVPNVTTML